MTTAEFLEYLHGHQATDALADDLASALIRRVVNLRDRPVASQPAGATTTRSRIAS